jgi:putative nucleotidyltransferase with HDIG domain
VLVGSAIFLCAFVNNALRPHNTHGLVTLAVFFILIFCAELLSVKFFRGLFEFTMTMPVVVGVFLSQGMWTTIVTLTLGMSLAMLFQQRDKTLKRALDIVCFNASTYIISVAVASVAYQLAGGRTLVEHGYTDVVSMAPPLLLWVAVCTTVDLLLFAIGSSLLTHQSWQAGVIQSFRWFIPNYIITGPSGILFAYMYQQYGVAGILLFVLPFIVGRQALDQYSTQIDTYMETITTLGSYMQHYHAYTRGHLERVADLADEIGREVRLSPKSLLQIRDAGLLHDIGKVGVNEEVLDKVGKLTDDEWGIIKQHPARGAEILAGMKYLEPIVPWVRGHHERPDGKGYPDSLVGRDIPLEAAVIAVADAFDAMTGGPDEQSQRVYRKPLTIDQAVDQVRYGAGTQFDSRVVKAFMRVMARRASNHGE